MIRPNKVKQKKASNTEIDPSVPPSIMHQAMKEEGSYARLGFWGGLLVILIGAAFIAAEANAISQDLEIKFADWTVVLKHCTPGVVILFIGLLIIVISRYTMKIK